MSGFFDTKIEFLKGVGPQKAELLNKELNIFTFGDLIQHYPFRYEDRTKYYKINSISPDMTFVQVKGVLRHLELIGAGRRKRLVAFITDDTGELELVWFQGIQWVVKKLKKGVEYIAFGRPAQFNGRLNIAHPEIEISTNTSENDGFLQPVYSTTEKLKLKYLDSKAIFKLQMNLLEKALPHIVESLPENIIREKSLLNKKDSILQVHKPENRNMLSKALFRLKFEELFYIQLRLLRLKLARIDKFKGQVFSNTSLLNEFYHKHLPFELTNAQKKVIKEIIKDLRSGHQMNRLMQGDVGSGKTIVAFITMLVVISDGGQVAMMAPTEILAEQHYQGLSELTERIGLKICLLTGSTKSSVRKEIHEKLENGEMNIIIGTHALLEEKVKFKSLGMAITDEQHRFGVEQRSKLWQKTEDVYPHILIMSATPIPRTLAMTLYGDLDVSVIDELPKGRKQIHTIHKYDSHRIWVFGFIKKEIEAGRQVYIVYPLIEESEKLDLKHLTDGYEAIKRAFPKEQIGIVHGKMKSQDKDYEMKRFASGQSKILVATTVIEVGVNVPNATVMIIENAERFGLSQLHQLRGRVGRGADQSYCILMSNYKLTKEAKERIKTMVRTTDGFEIAEADLKLRGPGDMMGTQQSGLMDLLISDLSKDGIILQAARETAKEVLREDPSLTKNENLVIRKKIESFNKNVFNWSKIS
mgnify:CR=1 FL=1